MKKQIIDHGWNNITGVASESIWLVQLFADRSAVMMHSSAAILNGNGLMFIGRSEACKITTTRMLQRTRDINCASVSILCDETNILRRWDEGWRVHGTWEHGEEEQVSGLSGPLYGVFVLKQDESNTIKPLPGKTQILNHLLSTVFWPLMTQSWWQ